MYQKYEVTSVGVPTVHQFGPKATEVKLVFSSRRGVGAFCEWFFGQEISNKVNLLVMAPNGDDTVIVILTAMTGSLGAALLTASAGHGALYRNYRGFMIN